MTLAHGEMCYGCGVVTLKIIRLKPWLTVARWSHRKCQVLLCELLLVLCSTPCSEAFPVALSPLPSLTLSLARPHCAFSS